MLRIVNKYHLPFLGLIILAPFIAYLIAETMHVSGVIAVVTVGFGVSKLSAERFPDRIKQDSKTVRELIVFLLNGLIFILIGTELPLIIKSIDLHDWWSFAGYAFMITIVALLIRTFRVSVQRKKLAMTLKHPRYENTRGKAGSDSLITFQESVIIGWSGMRGIVSLAMAISLPVLMHDGTPFPMRNEIIFITTLVVLFTIIGQGMLLPLIMKRLSKGAENKKQLISERNV